MYEIFDVSKPGMFDLVAQDDHGRQAGEVYGYLDGYKLEVGRIDVTPDNRRHGLGKKLWEAFIGKAKVAGATEVSGQLTSDVQDEADALAFYEKIGVEVDELGRLHKKL